MYVDRLLIRFRCLIDYRIISTNTIDTIKVWKHLGKVTMKYREDIKEFAEDSEIIIGEAEC